MPLVECCPNSEKGIIKICIIFIQKSQMKFHISKLWSRLNDLGGTPWCFKTLKIISSRYPPFQFQPCRWNFGPNAQVECYNVSNFQNLILKVPNIFINVGVAPSWPHTFKCTFCLFILDFSFPLYIFFAHILSLFASLYTKPHLFHIYIWTLFFITSVVITFMSHPDVSPILLRFTFLWLMLPVL